MKFTKEEFKWLRGAKNSIYDDIKVPFLYHSNKLEGSTFTEKGLWKLYLDKQVSIKDAYDDIDIDDVIETMNSLLLFDRMASSLGEKINKDMLCEWHHTLKSGTSDDKLGFVGHYKEIPNRIRGASIELALPEEVEPAIDELLNNWYSQECHSLEDVAKFHSRFEHIHPFQDGNGRLGRYLIFKQCIENDIDIIAIDDEWEKLYKYALEVSQRDGDFEQLITVFKNCQDRFDLQMEPFKQDILYVKKMFKQEMQEESNYEDDGLEL